MDEGSRARMFTSMMETFAGSGATDYPIGGDEGVINRDTSSATDSVAATFGVDNVASIFGVSIASLEIDNVERQAVMDAIFALCDKFMASLKQSHEYDPITDGTIPCVVSHVDETPIVQSVSVQDKPSSYVGVACVSVVKMVSTRYDNILCGYFIRKRIAFPIVEYYARNNWGKFGLTRIMMNSKGFFFEFKTIKGLEDVLENRPWMIQIDVADVLKESLTMDVPLIEDSGFSIETITTPTTEKANDEFQTVEKKRRRINLGASNVGNASKSVSSHVSSMSKNHPLKAIVPLSSSRRSPNVDEGGNITVSNSYVALDDEGEEEVENVYDESANLFNSTFADG
ncbi:hypothetical protein Tco_0170012 [Tanacetum coccineum]